MDDPATTGDGDYAILFNNHVSNLAIDNSIIRYAEIYPIYFNGTTNVTNVPITNSTFDNPYGGPTTQMVRFGITTNANTITIDHNTFNADFRNSTNATSPIIHLLDKPHKLQAVITDVPGKVLSTKLLTAQTGRSTFTTNVSRYANGTYFLRFVSANGFVKTDKFLIHK